jgi:hypothetical protein
MSIKLLWGNHTGPNDYTMPILVNASPCRLRVSRKNAFHLGFVPNYTLIKSIMGKNDIERSCSQRLLIQIMDMTFASNIRVDSHDLDLSCSNILLLRDHEGASGDVLFGLTQQGSQCPRELFVCHDELTNLVNHNENTSALIKNYIQSYDQNNNDGLLFQKQQCITCLSLQNISRAATLLCVPNELVYGMSNITSTSLLRLIKNYSNQKT